MATDAELENLVVRLTGEGSEYQKMLQQAETQTKQSAAVIEGAAKRIEGFNATLKGFASTALGYLGSLGIVGSLSGAFAKFEQFQDSQIRLRGALKGTGQDVEATTAKFVKFSGEIAATTTTSKGATMQLLQHATAMGVSGDRAQTAAKNAIALAEAMGGEASEFLRVSIAMEQGNTMLVRHMLHLQGVTSDAEVMRKAQERVAIGMEIAQERGKTFTAELARAKAAFGVLSKEVGAVVAGYLEPLVRYIKEATEMFKGLDAGTKKTLVTTLTLIAAIIPSVSVYGMVSSRISSVITWFEKLNISMKNQGGALAALGASWQLWAVAGAAVGYLAYKVIQELTGETEFIRKQNEAIAEGKRLREANVKIGGEIGQELIEGIDKKEFLADKQRAVADELAKAKKVADGLAQQAEWRRRNLNLTRQEVAAERGEAEGAAKVVEMLEEKSRALNKTAPVQKVAEDLNKIIKDANKQLATVDLTEPQKKLFDVRQETKAIPEVQAYRRELAKLEEQFAAGSMSFEEHAAALKKIQDAYSGKRDIIGYTTALNGLKADLNAGHLTAEEYRKKVEELELSHRSAKEQVDALEEAERILAETQAKLEAKQLQKDIDQLTSSLEEQVQTFGMTSREANLFKLALRGASEEQLAAAKAASEELDALGEWQKAMEKGKQIAEEVKTPFEKLADKLEDLDNLFLKGAISFEVYTKATDKAVDDYEAATKQANKLKEAIKFDAALAGSAEALARISAFQDLIKPAADQASAVRHAVQANRLTPEDKEAQGAVAEALESQEPILLDIQKILEQIRDSAKGHFGENPNLQYPEADLNGNLGVGD